MRETKETQVNSESISVELPTLDQIIKITIDANPGLILSENASSRNGSIAQTGIDTPCFPDHPDGYDCTVSNGSGSRFLPTKVIQGLPNRPSCNNMLISYDVVICVANDPSITPEYQYYFYNFEANIGNCPAFLNWYNSLSDADKAEQQDIWEYELGLIEELSIVQATAPFLDTNCPETYATSSFINELCYTRCLERTEIFPFFKVVKSKCGAQCCVRTRNACKGISGAVLFSEPTFETFGDQCPSTNSRCKIGSSGLSKTCGTTCGSK